MSATPRYFEPRRLCHVILWVVVLALSEWFYLDCFGLTVEFTEPDLIASFLGTGQTPHDLGMIEKTNGVDRTIHPEALVSRAPATLSATCTAAVESTAAPARTR